MNLCYKLILLLLLGHNTQQESVQTRDIAEDTTSVTQGVIVKHTTPVIQNATVFYTEPKYIIKETFETWKESIHTRNDSIFLFEKHHVGYRDSSHSNAAAIYDVKLSIFKLDEFNNLIEVLHKKSISDPDFQPMQFDDEIVNVFELEYLSVEKELQKFIPDSVNIVSVIRDTTIDNKPRVIISWIDFEEVVGSQKEKEFLAKYSLPEIKVRFDKLCGLAILEFDDNWELVFLKQYDQLRWQGTIVSNINKVGHKEILFKYVGVGGSGYTTYCDLILRKL